MGERSILPSDLINHINKKGVFYPAQAMIAKNPITTATMWMTSDDLEMTGLRAVAWSNFTMDLNGVGIAIQPNLEDALMWSGDGKKWRLISQKCIRRSPFYLRSPCEARLAKKVLEVATSSEGKSVLLAGYS
jgi:hypothetical protein